MKTYEYKSGILQGTIYCFTDGDMKIHWHKHENNQCHNIIVLSGMVTIEFLDEPEAIPLILIAGDFPYDFDGSREHRITATGENTVILNLLTNP